MNSAENKVSEKLIAAQLIWSRHMQYVKLLKICYHIRRLSSPPDPVLSQINPLYTFTPVNAKLCAELFEGNFVPVFQNIKTFFQQQGIVYF
jgi:hypothetical protein